MSEDDLRKTFSGLEAAIGQATDWGEEQSVLVPPYRITILPVNYEKADINLQITWQDRQIAGLFYNIQQKAEQIQEELPEGIVEEIIQVGELNLKGLLTLPAKASDPLPAVVLVHGSGPSDRDETVRGTKLFRDLAHSLAQLPRELQELGRIRMLHPEASLEELGQMLNPPMGKSGVNHRMRRLMAMRQEDQSENQSKGE